MKKVWVLSVVVILLASTSWAVPVTFIHRADGGEFQGTLDGNPFMVPDFTITAFGDTSAREAVAADIFSINHTSAQIDIPNVGVFTFLTPTRTFVNQGSNAVGFSRAGSSTTDLFNEVAIVAGAFGSYDLLSSIGPIFGDGQLLQWDSPSVLTTGGVLVFADGFPENASYLAIVENGGQVSEPGILGLLALGWLASRRASRRR